jgi:hypothetical protein
MRSKFLTITFLCSFLCSNAQNLNVANQNHLWLVYTGTFHLYKKLHLFTEYQFRRADLGKNWQQSLPRIGLEIKCKPEFQITAGYGYITTYPYGEQPVSYVFNEHRSWEQINLVHSSGKFKFQHRYRLEQRWLERKILNTANNEFEFDEFNYLNRFRYRFMANYSIKHFETSNNDLFALFTNEIFIAFGKNVSKNIFDQNRIYGGIGINFKNKISVALGYLNQFILKTNGINAENNHTVQFSFNLML